MFTELGNWFITQIWRPSSDTLWVPRPLICQSDGNTLVAGCPRDVPAFIITNYLLPTPLELLGRKCHPQTLSTQVNHHMPIEPVSPMCQK
ncbi:hypothetical protein D9757_010874 [Collybiopsis confluens]|uniref:Uncharacterized protein n=1 Tax=Collybiopsis confluens TaxID=2823264 RepID=A0A8H5H7Z3_9AGAR|nr:hypothetical protein D9757_010874 [Collybiopsis confluens]